LKPTYDALLSNGAFNGFNLRPCNMAGDAGAADAYTPQQLTMLVWAFGMLAGRCSLGPC